MLLLLFCFVVFLAPNISHETVTLEKFDLMDGSPVKGEAIPVRFFLGNIPELTPTYRNVYNKYSVKYFLNLVIVDENNRRFFKQQEIVLWRRAPVRVLKSAVAPPPPPSSSSVASAPTISATEQKEQEHNTTMEQKEAPQKALTQQKQQHLENSTEPDVTQEEKV